MPSQEIRGELAVTARAIALAGLLCALVLSAAGCKKRSVQAAPPVVAAPTAEPGAPPPTRPETRPEPTPPSAPPTAKPTTTEPAPKPAAARPRPVSTPPATTEPAAPAPKPAPPQISPRLSPVEQAEYQNRTNAAVAAAEKVLKQAEGRQLNVTQHDLVEKIRSFLAQAREAIRAADWLRAYNLAQKAEALSVELAASL